MKYATKGSFIRLSLLLLCIGALFAYFALTFTYRSVSVVNSPDKHFKAHLVRSVSEGGAAPYGEHIFISSWYQPFPYHYLEPVFAGYCVGDPVIKWIDSQSQSIEIQVREKKSIIVQKSNYKGLTISYHINSN